MTAAEEEQGVVAVDLTDLEKKIIRQVEYYFGDVNLARDKFLIEAIAADEGWVTLETMLNFNRLKSITDDATQIATALKKSTLMEVSEDEKKIRRSPKRPRCDLSKDDLRNRSIYAKGFPLDLTLDQAMEFFEKFGQTDSIHMRKDTKKIFKGSCFVTYSNESGAKNFLESPDVKYRDVVLIRFLRDDYFKHKLSERKQKSEEKAKQSEEQQQAKDKEETETVKEKMTSGTILDIEGIPAQTRREDLKEYFLKYGAVEWVDFDKGDTKSRIRFSSKPDAAKEALEKAKAENEDKVVINGAELKCRVLEGDEEVQHWVSIFKAKKDRQSSSKDKFKKRRKGGDRRSGPPRKKGRKFSNKGSKDEADDDGDDDNDDDE